MTSTTLGPSTRSSPSMSMNMTRDVLRTTEPYELRVSIASTCPSKPVTSRRIQTS